MIVYALLLLLSRYPFVVLPARRYGRPLRTTALRAWLVTGVVTWSVAVVAGVLWPHRDAMFFALVLAPPVVSSAVTVAVVTTGWARVLRAIAWAVLGYLLGLAVRQLFDAPSELFDVSLPAVYAASGAVLACVAG